MKFPTQAAFFLLLCGLFAFRSAGVEFETKFLLGNRIELKIPKDFTIMSEEMVKLKYTPERRPTLIYTNEVGDINVALNLTNSRTTQAQLLADKDNLLHTYRHQYMGARQKWDGIQMVNGRKVGFIEFGNGFIQNNTVYGTPATENGVYNLIFLQISTAGFCCALLAAQIRILRSGGQRLKKLWLR